MKIFIGFLLLANNVFASTEILKQGKVIVSFDDIDGFSLTIPRDKRNGFFSSPERIEHILKNVLKMKHFMYYAELKNIAFPQSINKKVESRLLDLSIKSEEKAYTMKQQADLTLLNKYIKLEEKYNYVRNLLNENVTKDNIEELAKEEYLINMELYNEPKSRDVRYISFLYDESSKEQQKIKAEKVLSNIKESDFLDYIEKNLTDKDEVEVSLDLKNFKYTKKHKKISDFIFNAEQVGLIDNLLDFNSRYNIFYVYKINNKSILPFETVKEQIITNLYRDKKQRFFINLYAELTQDKVDINEEAIKSLRSRYLLKAENG